MNGTEKKLTMIEIYQQRADHFQQLSLLMISCLGDFDLKDAQWVQSLTKDIFDNVLLYLAVTNSTKLTITQ